MPVADHKTRVQVTMTKTLRNRLRKEASSRGQSLSAFIAEHMEREFPDHEKDKVKGPARLAP